MAENDLELKYQRKLKSDEKILTNLEFGAAYSKHFAKAKENGLLFSDYFCIYNLELWEEFALHFKKFSHIPLEKGLVVPLFYSNEFGKQNKISLGEKFEYLKKIDHNIIKNIFASSLAEYWGFVASHEEKKLKEYMDWYIENEKLNTLERQLISEYGRDDEDLISIYGYQLWKLK